MRYSEYGKTGKMVSAVGFGGMRFDMKKPDEENAELVLYAASKGINYFDSAPYYCDDRSETILGLAFKQLKAGSFYIATKCPLSEDTEQKSYDMVRRSLDKLQQPKIHFYHLWNLRKTAHFDHAVAPGRLYDGLLRAQSEGLIEHICCSTHQDGAGIRRTVESGLFEGVLMGVNILNFMFRWDGILACNDLNLGVACMNPLAGGVIPQHCDALAFLADEGETPTDAALRFLIANPRINIALNGFTTREHVDQACRVAENVVPLNEAAMTRIKENISRNLNEICTGCGYCRRCPAKIPIPGYMMFYNQMLLEHKSREDMIKLVEAFHGYMGVADRVADAKDCIKCGFCEERCTQHLPIISRLTEMAEWEVEAEKIPKRLED